MTSKLSLVTAIKDGLDLFKQTFPTVVAMEPSEWIIIDDASTEKVGTYITDAVAKAHSNLNIRYERVSTSIGQTKCLNKAISIASGDWIVRIDGDDLMSSERLRETAKAIESNTNAMIVFSDYDVIDINNRVIAEVKYNSLSSNFFDYFLTNNPICHPTVSFRKTGSDGQPLTYNENLKNAQDFALWKQIYKSYGEKAFVHISRSLVKYRIVPSSLSGALIREQQSELAAIQTNRIETIVPTQSRANVLTSSEQDGMYAYRALYYDFISEHSKLTQRERAALLSQTAKYRPVFLKATWLYLWGLNSIARKVMKQIQFRGIYK